MQELEQQRLRQEEAAAAAVAAEAERQRREREAAAAEATRRRVEEERAAARAKRKAEAAAAKAAAAAEEAQRQERVRLENQAAAKEWLNRGNTAVAQGEVDTAAKALQKAAELDPSNTQGIQRLIQELNTLKQRAAAAAAAAAGGSSGSSGMRSPAPGHVPAQAGRPPSLKKQRPTWELSMREDVPGLLSAYAAGGHERSPVGWWCALLSLVLYCFTWLCAGTVSLCDVVYDILDYASPLTWFLMKGCLLVQRLANGLIVLPLMLLVVWRQAWLVPLTFGALLRRLGGDTADKASTWLAKASGYLQHTESLQAAGIKLCLTLTSAATVWAAAMAVFVVEFGGDTLAGWVW